MLRENLRTAIGNSRLIVKEISAKSGVKKRTIDKWVGSSATEPKVGDLHAVCKVLGVTIEWLLTGKEGSEHTKAERVLIVKYRRLTDQGQYEVNALLDAKLKVLGETTEKTEAIVKERSEKMTQALFVGEPMPAYGGKATEKEPAPLYIVRDNETGEDVSQVPWDANVVFLNEGLVEIPEIGATAAGSPIDFEDIDPDPPMRLWAASFIRGDRENYRCVRVQGASMTEADIQDGDRALLVRARTAENGEIMLVRDEDSSTLKRIRVTKGSDGREEVWMCWEDGSGHREMLNDGHQIQARLVAIERKPRKR